MTAAQVKKWFRARTDAERYKPPYFWRGPRPQIADVRAEDLDGVGTTIQYGKKFKLVVSAVAGTDPKPMRAALIRFGAITHGNNMDQRYVWLTTKFESTEHDNLHYTVTAPHHRGTAPPGDYMLVVVDEFGVPSKAKVVRVA